MNPNDKLRLSIRMILTAASFAVAATPGHAQTTASPAATTSAAPAAAADDTLEVIVVTASAGDKSKLDTSTSISSVTQDQIQDFDATSTAEAYRMIPGIQVAGTQGDGGNSNIGVRGLRTPDGRLSLRANSRGRPARRALRRHPVRQQRLLDAPDAHR